MQTIYLDVLIGVNIYINYLLLIITARLASCRQNRARISIAAAAGALSSCTMLLDIPSNLLGAAIKLITVTVMSLIAFEIKSFRTLMKVIIILTTVTFGFAGAMIGIKNIMSIDDIAVSNYSVYIDISPIALIFFTLICYFLLSLYSRITAKRTVQNSSCRLTISSAGKSVTLDALLDTGNTLTEPFSGLPVVVVNERNVYHLLPEELKNFDRRNPQPGKNIRLIPYASVGGTGLLTGFMPDSITVEREGRESRTNNVYIAVAERETDAPALINPDILD